MPPWALMYLKYASAPQLSVCADLRVRARQREVAADDDRAVALATLLLELPHAATQHCRRQERDAARGAVRTRLVFGSSLFLSARALTLLDVAGPVSRRRAASSRPARSGSPRRRRRRRRARPPDSTKIRSLTCGDQGQVVLDEQHAGARRRSSAARRFEPLALLRGQPGGGLVEQQQPWAATPAPGPARPSAASRASGWTPRGRRGRPCRGRPGPAIASARAGVEAAATPSRASRSTRCARRRQATATLSSTVRPLIRWTAWKVRLMPSSKRSMRRPPGDVVAGEHDRARRRRHAARR